MQAMRRLLTVALAIAGLVGSGAAAAFTIQAIEIRGAERTEEGTVRNYLPLSAGEDLNARSAQQAIHALYDTGFFRDIQLLREGDSLIVDVQEKPRITAISLEGLEEVKPDRVREAFRSFGLAERRVYSRSAMRRAELELERQYHAQGYYAARVSSEVIENEEGGVRIRFQVEEGAPAKITQIRIVGNEAFPEAELKGELNLTDAAAFSFLSGGDQYARQKLMGDLETLRSYYMDRGYIRFRVDSSQVQISPDRKHVFVTLNVSEGAQYRIRQIDFAGETVVPPEELRGLVTLAEGDLFSRSKVQETVEAISRRVGDEGYAFANVSPVPDVDEENHTVGLTFRVDPGRRVNVRRIHIEGNDRTRDRVIRRELRQLEGARYQRSKVERSKERVNRLGYFDEVNLETPTSPGSQGDEVDMDLSVKERQTGQFSLGLGYSDVEGLMFTSSVKQDNLFGTGQRVSLQADIGGVNQTFNLSFTEPYFTVNGVSLGGDVYYTKRDTDRLTVFRYSQDRAGAAVRMGFPLSEYWRDTVRLAVEQTDTKSGTLDLGPEGEELLGQQTHVLLRNTLSYDSRDSTIFPRDGMKHSLKTTVAVPPGDTRYVNAELSSRLYFPVLSASSVTIGGDLGRMEGYGGEVVPFYERYYMGGSRSVRGYDTYSLGPKDLDGDPIGGVTKLQGNAELRFPMPGSDSRRIRGALFTDAGWVYGQDQGLDPGKLRGSVGAGFRWISPMGPLRFDFAFPVMDEPQDDTKQFHFSVGTGL